MSDARDNLWAAMFKIKADDDGDVFYVMADEDGRVRAFSSGRKALDFFEKGNQEAMRRGLGWAAGAMLSFAYLRPKVFSYGTFDDLRQLLEDSEGLVKLHSLTNIAVHEKAFRCIDQDKAKKIYEVAIEPR